MASHSHVNLSDELTQMRPGGRRFGLILMAGGLAAIVLALIAALPTTGGVRRFWFAYLWGLGIITAISCASLISTLIQHLVRAGWVTNVRRILETMALQVVLAGVLALPVVALTLFNSMGSNAKGTQEAHAATTQPGEGHALTKGETHGEGNAGELPAPTGGTLYSWAVPGDTPIVEHEEGAEHTVDRDADDQVKVEHKEGPDHVTPADPAVAHAATSPSAPSVETMAGHVGELATRGNEHIQYPNEQVQPGVNRAFNEIVAKKRFSWLNPWFWALRVIVYFGSLGFIAYSYWSTSVRQDASGDLDLSDRMFGFSGPCLIVAGFFTTFISFDLFMSLDPEWFSTMFGVYFFASGMQAMWAVIALFVLVLQWRGYLTQSVTQEHRHDIGKFLWAFIFFFAYIAYDQYMLQWYANLPEETFWFDKRGYSTQHPNGYSAVVVALLLGRWLIPFAGLLSRHVKRNKFGLGFWAAWLLVFYFVDIYLMVIPESYYAPAGGGPRFGLPELLAFLGFVALWLGNVVRVLGSHALRPVRDPRVHESLALQNF